MVDNIEEIEKEVLKNISKAESFDELQKIKIAELGKKGRIKSLIKSLSSLNSQDKKEQGIIFNSLRDKINKNFENRLKQIKDKAIQEYLSLVDLNLLLYDKKFVRQYTTNE